MRIHVAWCVVAMLLIGCGGGSGGSPSGGGPGAVILFPPSGFLTDAPTLNVNGTATSLTAVVMVTLRPSMQSSL